MKLINIKMEYFGPFESEEINFSSLNNKLFLISGRTGSGKTMIFDAIVYALYGSASTTGRDEESLRSQFAPEDKQAQVNLTFEVRGKQYTVERILKYHKPGNKSATPPKAVLYDEENNIIAGKLNEVRDMVENIVKLNRAQFRKILILPQGEFKELLVSSSTDKQEILRTLFQTGRFLDFENNLREKLKEQSSEAATLDMRINERVKHIHIADIIVEEQQAFPNYNAVLEYVDEVILGYDKKVEQLTVDGKNLKEALENTQLKLKHKEKHNEQIGKLKNLEEQLDLLKQKAQSIDTWRTEIGNYDEVFTIRYELMRHKELESSLMEISNELLSEQENKTTLDKNLEEVTKELAELETKSDQMNSRTQQYYKHEAFLSDLYQTIDNDIDTAEKQLEKKEADSKELTGKISVLSEEISNITMTREASNEIQEEQYEITKKYDALTEEIKIADEQQKLVTERIEIKRNIEQNNKQSESLKDELFAFNSKLTDYDDETVQTINHLISHLEVGVACPVCEQNVLILPESSEFTKEDRELMSKITESIDSLQAKNQKYVMRIDVIDEVLKDKHLQDVDMLEVKLKSFSAEKDMIDAKKIEANNLLVKKEKLRDDLATDNDDLHTLNLSFQELKNNLKQLTVKRTEFHKTTGFTLYNEFKTHMDNERNFLNEFQKNLNIFKNKVNDVTKQRDLCHAKVKSLETDKEKIVSSIAEFKSEIEAFMNEYQYTDITHLFSIIDDASIQNKKEAVKAFDENNLSLKNNIDEIMKTVKSTESINVDEDIESVKNAEAALETAREYYATVNERRSQNNQSKNYLSDLIDTFNASYEEFSQLNELVDAVQGKKGQKVSLERYVLTYYLERILELANVRLVAMTNHRYKLQRSMKKVNRYSGLDIEVFDFYNNQARNINSLSGGETFQASLVLALALNEALQQESGGITLDTMLIDEGFGTLDHETLEVAISTLIDLQTTGKTIGIISHVEELKERMEHILYVKPNNERSTTEIMTL